MEQVQQQYGVDWLMERDSEPKATWDQFKMVMAKMKEHNLEYGVFMDVARKVTGYPFDAVWQKHEPRFTRREADQLIKLFDGRLGDPFRPIKVADVLSEIRESPQEPQIQVPSVNNQDRIAPPLVHRCANCGEEYPHVLSYCEVCGATMPPIKTCDCGYSTSNSRAQHCGRCGKKLR